jgi:hypothetical protein
MVRRLPVPRSSLRAWMEPVRLGWALVTPHAPGHGRGLVSSLLHRHHGGKCPTFIRHQSTVDRLVKLSGTTEPVGSASAYDADGTHYAQSGGSSCSQQRRQPMEGRCRVRWLRTVRSGQGLIAHFALPVTFAFQMRLRHQQVQEDWQRINSALSRQNARKPTVTSAHNA